MSALGRGAVQRAGEPRTSAVGGSGGDARTIDAAVFSSGSGSNFQALLEWEGKGALWRTRLLVVDREGTGAMERARQAGIEVRGVAFTGRDPSVVGEQMLGALREAHVDVIFLAGFLRLVTSTVVAAYRDRILNIHPALLPAFGGKGMWGRAVHEAVLRSAARVTGVTVHLVDDRYDEGRILAQWPVPVHAGDDPDTLAARVLEVEHLLYPLAAQQLCRALAAGTEPAPLAALGRAFSLVDEPGVSSLAHLVKEAFQAP